METKEIKQQMIKIAKLFKDEPKHHIYYLT